MNASGYLLIAIFILGIAGFFIFGLTTEVGSFWYYAGSLSSLIVGIAAGILWYFQNRKK